jgi:hypothetical protein
MRNFVDLYKVVETNTTSKTCPSCGTFPNELARAGFVMQHDLDATNGFAAHVLRGVDGTGEPAVALSKTAKPEAKINGWIDALHLAQLHGKPQASLVLEQPDDSVRQVLAILSRTLERSGTPLSNVVLSVNQFVDGAAETLTLIPPVLDAEGLWLDLLCRRDAALPPQLAVDLSRAAPASGLAWYPPFSASRWSGRLDGLEICTIGSKGSAGVLKIGGGKSPASSVFAAVANGPEVNFTAANVAAAGKLVARLATERKTGGLKNVAREHRLESRILHGELLLEAEGAPLEIVAGQFPTRWHIGGPARYLDLLMRRGKSTPIALELKVSPRGAANGLPHYFRHGLVQALLYREFIRSAESLDHWFRVHRLRRGSCGAALAFPRHGSETYWNRLKNDIEPLAEALGVHVIYLDEQAAD